jgi:alanyl-tRNA synthetase
MTTRLYYTDPLLREFDARVVSCGPAREGGSRFEAVLDRTAFYPTSGGQPHDVGTIGGARVLDVIDADDEIRHVLETPIPASSSVQGAIDWVRRFDHMQQHTGQHILSAAFDRGPGVRTMSFHLGADTATIDLAREVSAAEIDAAEDDANRVVWEDRPVSVRFVTDEEAARLPLRKDPARTGTLRLVEVTDYDLSACGGTHVPRTGMIGVIAVAGWERFKGATRLTFVCGGRALRAHATLRDVVVATTRALSVLPGELPAAVVKLQAELKDAAKSSAAFRQELAGFRAIGLRQKAETIGPYRGVLMAQPGEDAAVLKTLAAAIVSEPGFVVVFAGEGRPAPVVVARSADVTIDAGAWIKRATTEFGGRGGGRPEQAQGGIDAAADQVIDFARRTLL